MAKRSPAAEKLTVDRLIRDPQNRRVHTPRNLEMISASLKSVGAGRSIVIDENDEILAGNGVVQAAADAGLTKVRVVEADGDTIVAVRRTGLSQDEKRALAIYDNRAGELSEWNAEQLQADRDAGLDLRPFWTEEEEAALASHFATEEVKAMAAERVPRTVEARSGEAVEFATFNCPLSVEQERTVRAALRRARVVYSAKTTGEALAAALHAWLTTQETAPGADTDEPETVDGAALS